MHRIVLLETDVELLLPLSRYLQLSLAQQWGLDLSTRMQIVMALEEAMLNAMYHGSLELDPRLKETDDATYFQLAEKRRFEDPFCNRQIQIDVRLTPETATYTIHDEGPGFDQSILPDKSGRWRIWMRPCGRWGDADACFPWTK